MGPPATDVKLAGERGESYEVADASEADEMLRVGGDSDGVREGARDEPRDDEA
jgi:hypothetical protein